MILIVSVYYTGLSRVWGEGQGKVPEGIEGVQRKHDEHIILLLKGN